MNRHDPSIVRTTFMWPDREPGIRSAPDGTGMAITGYAAVFGVPSKVLRFPGLNRGRPFREIIEPGAFNRTLNSGRDVVLLWQHDPMQLPLASTGGGTMRLTPDSVGLRTDATLPDNEHGRPFRDAIDRRDVRGMSFRMPRVVDNARPDGTFPVETLADGSTACVRRVREVMMMPEVSITNMPAYAEASVHVRSIAEEIGVDPDALESAMRSFEAGTLTVAERDAIISAATLRAAAAMACCDACGDQAPGCCATDSRCPAECSGSDCAECACGPSTIPGTGDGVAATRSDPEKMALMRRRYDALRRGEDVRHTPEPAPEPSAGAATRETTSPAGPPTTHAAKE